MIPIQILESWVGRSIGMNLILQFFAGLDRITFTVFGWVMQAIFDIANTEIIKDTVYSDFETRVYVILGIFMLFKVTISLLTYLVNPDKINDKESGMGKMVTRTIVVICMLIGLPFLFNLLNRAQPILLESLPKIIIGKDMSINTNSGEAISSSLSSQAAGISDRISWQVFQLALNEDTVTSMAGENINTVDGATSVITEPESTDHSSYKYYYLPFVGSVIALIMSFLMVGLCIDIAIRSFKLVILRMIAPIPIISYIDPKSAKDGAFNGWVKALTSTWLDLFVRLGIIYFVLFMIDEVILKWNVNLDTRNAVVVVFLIVGLMFFAKQAPKFIMDILGIKGGKGLGVGFGGALAAGGALLGGAGLAGALAAGTTAMNENADAAAQGKAGTASWGKGRDIAAQIRSGDKNAKAGGALNRRFMDMSAERRANKLNLGADDVNALKTNMINQQGTLNEAKNALQEYEAGVQSGKYKYDKGTMEALQNNVIAANERSREAQKAFEDAKSARESLVRKNSVVENYGRRSSYIARVNAGSKGRSRSITTTAEYETKMSGNPSAQFVNVPTYQLADVSSESSSNRNNAPEPVGNGGPGSYTPNPDYHPDEDGGD